MCIMNREPPCSPSNAGWLALFQQVQENAMPPLETSIENASQKKAVLDPLLRLFADATRVRIRISFSLIQKSREVGTEKTTIEFATSRVVIFQTKLPLEIGERVRLRNSDGAFEADAVVIAVQYQDQSCGVAARFATEVRNWIIQA